MEDRLVYEFGSLIRRCTKVSISRTYNSNVSVWPIAIADSIISLAGPGKRFVKILGAEHPRTVMARRMFLVW